MSACSSFAVAKCHRSAPLSGHLRARDATAFQFGPTLIRRHGPASSVSRAELTSVRERAPSRSMRPITACASAHPTDVMKWNPSLRACAEARALWVSEKSAERTADVSQYVARSAVRITRSNRDRVPASFAQARIAMAGVGAAATGRDVPVQSSRSLPAAELAGRATSFRGQWARGARPAFRAR
jgi:hypothetical protein